MLAHLGMVSQKNVLKYGFWPYFARTLPQPGKVWFPKYEFLKYISLETKQVNILIPQDVYFIIKLIYWLSNFELVFSGPKTHPAPKYN